jgi:hypothetical protein
MTPSEAIDAMEGLGHDFFVFRDRDSNTIQVGISAGAAAPAAAPAVLPLLCLS